MRIDIALSEKSITQAINRLKVYKHGLPAKVYALIDEMTSYGEHCAINELGHIATGETLDSIIGYREGDKGFIVAGGNAVWIEFGTGVTYNGSVGSSPHPKGEELDMTIGTYGEGHGADPNGWYYPDGDKWTHTFGIEANMFMYKTAQQLREAFPDFAKEIFKDD